MLHFAPACVSVEWYAPLATAGLHASGAFASTPLPRGHCKEHAPPQNGRGDAWPVLDSQPAAIPVEMSGSCFSSPNVSLLCLSYFFFARGEDAVVSPLNPHITILAAWYALM